MDIHCLFIFQGISILPVLHSIFCVVGPYFSCHLVVITISNSSPFFKYIGSILLFSVSFRYLCCPLLLSWSRREIFYYYQNVYFIFLIYSTFLIGILSFVRNTYIICQKTVVVHFGFCFYCEIFTEFQSCT